VSLGAIDAMAKCRDDLVLQPVAWRTTSYTDGSVGYRCSKSPATIPPLKKFSAKPTSEPMYGLRHIA
jgi:hypothetical protein